MCMAWTSLKRRKREDKASIKAGHFTAATEPVTPNRICLVVNLALVPSLFIGAFDTVNAFCVLWPFFGQIFDFCLCPTKKSRFYVCVFFSKLKVPVKVGDLRG